MSGKNQKVILITGTSKGIGRFLAQHFIDFGHIVIGCSRSESRINAINYQHYSLDISDEAAVKKLFSAIRKQHGRLDILINNAGIASMNHAMLTPLASVRSVFETNVFASFLFCREAVKLMRKTQSGRIVNFTTVAVPLNLEGEAIYAASKAAIESLTKILAKEFAEFKVTVNALGPTPIDTDLIKNVPADKIQGLVEKQSIKRLGQFEDISNVIEFFVSDSSDFVTGQILYLGGV